MSSAFKPNRQVRAEITKQPEFQAHLMRNAVRVKTTAERIAPKGTSHVGYARRFRLRRLTAAVRVLNTDIAAHLIEWGSANNPPYAPLRRAVLAAGLRLDESLKQEDTNGLE